MRTFFDRNWSPYLARAIAALVEPDGDEVVHLDQRFDPSTPDVDWLGALAEEGGWAVVTIDRLRKSAGERAALARTGIVTFIFARHWARAQRWEVAWGLVRWWPRIQAVASSTDRGAWEVPYRFGAGRLRSLGRL